MRGWPGILPVVLAVGIAGGVVAIAGHAGDDAFRFAQEHSVQVEPTEVARLMAKAPEPVAGGRGARALDARCTAAGKQDDRNRWRCRVLYASGRRVAYAVTIAPNGSVRGVDPTGERLVRGCCLPLGR
jgi:hypothetical protein